MNDVVPATQNTKIDEQYQVEQDCCNECYAGRKKIDVHSHGHEIEQPVQCDSCCSQQTAEKSKYSQTCHCQQLLPSRESKSDPPDNKSREDLHGCKGEKIE